MLPRFLTPVEIEYNKKFPDSPALSFYPASGLKEAEGEFEALLTRAIERGEALREEEVVAYYGEAAYRDLKEYLEEWGGPITWPSK